MDSYAIKYYEKKRAQQSTIAKETNEQSTFWVKKKPKELAQLNTIEGQIVIL